MIKNNKNLNNMIKNNKNLSDDIKCTISDEINRHDNYIISLYRSKKDGYFSNIEYQSTLEFERNQLCLIINDILNGKFVRISNEEPIKQNWISTFFKSFKNKINF
jgi:hypothetical protein